MAFQGVTVVGDTYSKKTISLFIRHILLSAPKWVVVYLQYVVWDSIVIMLFQIQSNCYNLSHNSS